MMELVVVLPIYFVLFGGVFMLGDMLIRSIRLPSAERVRAFDLGRSDGKGNVGWNEAKNRIFHPRGEVNDLGQDTDWLTHGDENEYYADSSVECPFSVRTATKVKDEYSLLAGGSRGQMALAYSLFHDRLDRMPVSRDHDPVDDVEKDVPRLYGVGGRIEMYSKPKWTADGKKRMYDFNYYTLCRHRYGSEVTWRDNARPISDLVDASADNARWNVKVWQEDWHMAVSDVRRNRNSKSPPWKTTFHEYTRYPPFRNWSN